MSIAAGMLPEIEMELANTRTVLAALPESSFSFKPHAKSFAMKELASHVANMVGWGTMTLNTDSFDVAPVGQPPMKEPAHESTAALVDAFDRNAAEFKATLAAASDDSLLTPWSLLVAGQANFTMPRVAVLRSMIMNHLIHHRAQLTVYMRLCDLPVPAIYGPSADSAQ
jgi:uncharacterized damage-inducible protein DinB